MMRHSLHLVPLRFTVIIKKEVHLKKRWKMVSMIRLSFLEINRNVIRPVSLSVRDAAELPHVDTQLKLNPTSEKCSLARIHEEYDNIFNTHTHTHTHFN